MPLHAIMLCALPYGVVESFVISYICLLFLDCKAVQKQNPVLPDLAKITFYVVFILGNVFDIAGPKFH